MFFVVFISLFQPVPARWFHLVTVVLALDKWLQIFSPLMGCGSPFGGFVSPFVGFVGFCIWICFIFFAEITVANGYWWIWLWVHNREKRKIEVLGFVIYVIEVLVKMRDLLKVEPNGCLRLRLKSLISFIVIWLLRKFERTWECEKKKKKLWV